jgi:DNA-binding NtrC family response regulator
MLRVLIVEDQPHVMDALELLFEMQGKLEVARASSPDEAESAVRSGGIGVVVQDMNFTEGTTSGDEGAALFTRLRELEPDLPIILMTAWASIDRAVALVKQGADDYVQKPWDDAQLLKRVKNLIATRQRRGTLSAPPTPSAGGPPTDPDLCGLLFNSAAMHAVVSLAIKVARTDLPALITGPNGSGKEKVAEIVQANSPRRSAPFIRVNVGGLPDELFSAELFGAETGAFTGAKTRRIGRFEAADQGTLFLDEIGNLSMESQAKLLRAAQSGEFERLGSNQTQRADVRIIAATNVSMAEAIAAGQFREDLYYRLAVIELEVPPLAARADDILPLALQFARRHAGAGARVDIADDCARALERYAWPGNVRELQNRVQRALLLTEDGVLRTPHFGLGEGPQSRRPSAPPSAAPTPSRAAGAAPAGVANVAHTEEPELDRAERETIERALLQADHVIKHAAESLGLTRQALYRRMQRLGIKVKRDLSG